MIFIIIMLKQIYLLSLSSKRRMLVTLVKEVCLTDVRKFVFDKSC